MDDFVAQVSGVGTLADPVRRRLYAFVAAQPGPVSRDEAATGTGLARHTVKFHLDKLVTEGLLAAEFRRLDGRRGPGAGHPTKLYRRSGRQFEVSLPERRYAVAAQVLATAVEQAARYGTPITDAVRAAAAAAGRDAVAAAGPGPGDPMTVLAGVGYEPRRQDDVIALVNCPFHQLAREHTALTCDLSLHLVRAILAGTGADGLDARLDPGPGRCCVTIGPARAPEVR